MASATVPSPELKPIKPLPEDTGYSGTTFPEDRLVKRIFLSPTVILLLIFSIVPLIWSLGISFTDVRGSDADIANQAQVSGEAVQASGFLGLGFDVTVNNYLRMLSDERFQISLRNTLFYVFVGVTIQYVVGFFIAIVLNKKFRGRWFFQTVFLLPMMITPVAAGYLGRMMFDPSIAPLAQLIRTIGDGVGNLIGQDVNVVVPWLTQGSWAPWTIILIDSWQWIPFMMMILLAGMQAIPEEIYEAGRVDGATGWNLFWRITFPLMLPVSTTIILIRGLEMFKIVDIVRVATGGGPGSATESVVMYIGTVALEFQDYSYAAAISYVVLIMVIVFATLLLGGARRLSRWQTGS